MKHSISYVNKFISRLPIQKYNIGNTILFYIALDYVITLTKIFYVYYLLNLFFLCYFNIIVKKKQN